MELLVEGAIRPETKVAGLTRTGLQQALTHLILNASDAMSGRGRIILKLNSDTRQVRLFVLDEGPGLDPETRDRLFEPFFTTKAPGAGVGLGLYIVHQLAQRAGGSVTTGVAPGGGAAFELRFPMSGQSQE